MLPVKSTWPASSCSFKESCKSRNAFNFALSDKIPSNPTLTGIVFTRLSFSTKVVTGGVFVVWMLPPPPPPPATTK